MTKAAEIRKLKRYLDSDRPKSRLETLAVERQLRDLATAHRRGLVWDTDAADKAVAFFRLLRHWKGEFAGEPVALQPWQALLIVRPLFAWKRKADGLRRFRTAYIEVPRKNGKTTLLAGVGDYGLLADAEPGAEIYAAATKRDQAKILFSDARNLLRRSGYLRGKVGFYDRSIVCDRLQSKFEPLSADAHTLDGLNPHFGLVDELHAHKTSAVWDAIETGQGARRQPLLVGITTAGYDRHSVCWRLHEYAEKVLEKVVEDDTFLALITCAEEGDDFADAEVWAKANPNLDVSVKPDDLQRLAAKAQQIPSFENTFRRLRLNQWTEQQDRWLQIAAWSACADEYTADDLAGLPCWAGLDLSKTRDTTALVLVFPVEDDIWLLPWFWIPGDNAEARQRNDRVPYTLWHRQGALELTAGNVVDYRAVRNRIVQVREQFDLRGLAFDPYNATQFAVELTEEIDGVREFPQTLRHFAEPTQELEKLVVSKALKHNAHPVLAWQAANVAIKRNPDGLIRPVKPPFEDARKIDGIVAAIMGLGLWMADADDASVYEQRGILTI